MGNGVWDHGLDVNEGKGIAKTYICLIGTSYNGSDMTYTNTRSEVSNQPDS